MSADALRDALRAVRALEAERARVHAPVAVVGVGLRLPKGIEGAEALALALASGTSLAGPRPDARPGPLTTAAWITDLGAFDADALRLPPAEAARLDPNVRLLLEVAAVACAGLPPGPREDVGVFVGLSSTDHAAANLHQGVADPASLHAALPGVAASRLAYTLDLRGPAVVIDATCASGVLALEAAVQALRAGTCTQAVVASANLLLAEGPHARFAALGLLSPTGCTRPYAADGDGYVRGEAAVALLLTLAPEQGQAIGWIDGVASRVGGTTQGLGVPGPALHAEVASRAWAAGGRPDRLEGHGVGAARADAIEREGLARLWPELAPQSVKAVTGHTEAASGLVSIAAWLARGAVGEVLPGTKVGVHTHALSGHVAHVALRLGSGAWPAAPVWVRRPLPLDVVLDGAGDHLERARRWLSETVGREIDVDTPLSWQGVDSIAVASLLKRLEAAGVATAPGRDGSATLREVVVGKPRTAWQRWVALLRG